MSVTITGNRLEYDDGFTKIGILQNSAGEAGCSMAFYYGLTDGNPNMGMLWSHDKAAGVTILKGIAANRFSVESDAALVMIAANSVFEMEGANDPNPLNVTGYVKGSDVSKTINITNEGTASPQVPFRVTAADNEKNIQEWYQGTTLRAYIDKDGNFVRVSP